MSGRFSDRDDEALAGLSPVRRAGQPHVRPDRGALRPAELGDDRRPPPPLARAGGGPRRARRPATPPSTSAAEPATWPSSWPAASRPTATSSAATSPSRCSTSPARRRRAGAPSRSASSGPTRSSFPTTRAASTPSRSASASATSPTSTAACGDGPGAAARRAAGRPRVHRAAPPPVLDLLLALVRPDRAGPRAARRRSRRLRLPGRVGAQLPRPARPGGEDGRGGPRADPVHGPRRRHRHDPQRHRG